MISAHRGLGGSEDFRMMVDELGRTFVMKHLAISRQQLTAWLAPCATVPRANVLALYWESRWGRSLVDSDRETEIGALRSLARCHERTIETLRTRVSELEVEVRSEPGILHSANERWFSEIPSRSRRGSHP